MGAAPCSNVKMLLQSLGNAKTEAEVIIGAPVARLAASQSALSEEYPGGRQWNLDAAQFKYKPAELADDEVPCHPHWDMIFDHIGHELTPVLRELPWAIEANIKTGADYLRSWVACAFRDPFQPLPYLFLWPGGQREEHFYESLQRLVTKGVVKAERSLTSRIQRRAIRRDHLCGGGNGHFQGPRCPRQDQGVQHRTNHLDPQDAARLLRQPNATHWVQTANKREHCPVFPGDTRITAVYVSDLLEEQKSPNRNWSHSLTRRPPLPLYAHAPGPAANDRPTYDCRW